MNKNLTKKISNVTVAELSDVPDIKILKNMIKTLKLVGLWKQDQPYTLRHPSTLLFIISLLFSVNITMAEFSYTLKIKSILDVAAALGEAIGVLGIVIKFCDLFAHREQFFKLLKNLEDAFNETMSTGKYNTMLLNYDRQATRLFNLYLCLWWIIILSFDLMPVCIYGFKLAFGYPIQVNLQLPYKADIFYTSGIANRLIIDYILSIIGSISAILMMAPLDCYLGCACLYIIPHIKILEEDLENISYVSEKGRESEVKRRNMCLRSEVYLREKLLQFVKDHRRVISFVDQLEEVCNRQMLVHFRYTTFEICLLFFQATYNIHNKTKIFLYGLSSIGSFAQLLICAYYGQKLLNQTSRLEFAVYNTAWFDKSVKFKRLILLILMRVQKPLGVTAFKYFQVSIAAFGTVLKTMMSYFTLLQNVIENSNEN